METIETLSTINTQLLDDIENAQGTWKEKLEFREVAVNSYYDNILKINALTPSSPHARIFRLPFAVAPMYYQQKRYKDKSELFYCPDILVCTLGALLLTTKAGQEMTNGNVGKEDRVISLPFKVGKKAHGVTHLHLLEAPEKGSIQLNINIGRAVASTFHRLPEGDPSKFRIGYNGRRSNASFSNVYWKVGK